MMIRVRLPTVPDQGLSSPTLELEKFHAYDAFEDKDAFKTSKRDQWFHDNVIPADDRARVLYRDWHADFDDATRTAGAEILLRAKTDWRLVIGWATNPALEMGLTLHRLYGFPYLPGSALKGLVHRVAEIELMETDPVPDATPAALHTAPSQDLTKALTQARLIRAIFGSLHLKRSLESDLPETALEILEHWKERLHAIDGLTSDWKQVLDEIDQICGENLGGAAIFFDAVPDAHALLAASPLQVDVLTPHYGAYYKDLDNATPTVPPRDSDNPNPVKFLTVRPGLEFEFRVRVRMAGPWDDEAGREQSRDLGGRDAKALLDLLRDWLERGLEEMGIGGKTAAGYGYFARPRMARAVVPPTELDPDAFAAQYLVPNLPMNLLAPRIDDARARLTTPQQAAVARRLVTLYPDAVKAWRKQKDKEAARKRVTWLDEHTDKHTALKPGDES